MSSFYKRVFKMMNKRKNCVLRKREKKNYTNLAFPWAPGSHIFFSVRDRLLRLTQNLF